jgi:hypothetical protein
LEDGPTCDDFFTYYPSRVNERLPERRYDFVAQSVLASAYGYFQLPYPVALRNGFTDAPEELTTIEAIYIAGIALRNAVDDAEALGRTGPEALAFGLMSVSTQVPSRSRVAAIDDAHRALYGGGLFE